jgi:hypothetical protein
MTNLVTEQAALLSAIRYNRSPATTSDTAAMSELKLSSQLVKDLHALLAAHDPHARDPIVAAQYLGALTGFTLSSLDIDLPVKRDILEQINEFSRHVLEDIERDRGQPPPQQEAFGIWRASEHR